MLSDVLYKECEKLYLEGNSISKISKIKNVNRDTLSKKLKLHNINIIQKTRVHKVNEHYFDVIDSEEKAYILGFIYADGNNLFKLNRISISLSIRDKEILEKISEIFYNKQMLKFSKRKNKDGKEFEYVTLNVFSKHMSKHLATLGVVENKSYKIVFPKWLDKNLYKHFIRGLIDGDGWIYIPQNNRDSPNVGLISTREINDFLSLYFKQHLKLKSYLLKAHKQNFDIMCEIRIKNYHQCKILLDWLYLDASIFLKRKYDLYQDFLNKYSLLRNQNK